MRGGDVRTEALFSYVSCERRVPRDHPLRRVVSIVDAALDTLSAEFTKLYAPIQSPDAPIPCEKSGLARPCSVI
jgi:hypothetical protein